MVNKNVEKNRERRKIEADTKHENENKPSEFPFILLMSRKLFYWQRSFNPGWLSRSRMIRRSLLCSLLCPLNTRRDSQKSKTIACRKPMENLPRKFYLLLMLDSKFEKLFFKNLSLSNFPFPFLFTFRLHFSAVFIQRNKRRSFFLLTLLY